MASVGEAHCRLESTVVPVEDTSGLRLSQKRGDSKLHAAVAPQAGVIFVRVLSDWWAHPRRHRTSSRNVCARPRGMSAPSTSEEWSEVKTVVTSAAAVFGRTVALQVPPFPREKSEKEWALHLASI